MRLPVEHRGFESVYVVARTAIRAGGTSHELVAMRVFVTILAAVVRDRCVKIHVLVTPEAGDFCMFAVQSKLRLLVTEAGARFGSLPCCCVVTTLAPAAKLRLLKRSAVRILVAGLTALEVHTLELQARLPRLRPVTLHAGHGLMAAREDKFCAGMVKPGCGLPSIQRVALSAVGSHLPPMLILMARDAFPFQAEVGVIAVLYFDLIQSPWRNLLRVVARGAFERRVLALQHESCLLPMLKGLWVKSDQREVLTIVFQMASRAISLVLRGANGTAMIARATYGPSLDLGMAFQALEGPETSAKVVTGGAIGNTFQILMRSRERPR